MIYKYVNIDTRFACFVQLGPVHIFVQFRYAVTETISQWWLSPKTFLFIFLVYNPLE